MQGHTQVELLKMDIEGYEYELLLELTEQDYLPRVISIELHFGA